MWDPQLPAIKMNCLRPGLDAKFKISKLSHRICVAHAWSIKSRQNKKLIV